MKLIIIGAGGHGQVVADIFLAQQQRGLAEVTLAGFVDDDPALPHTSVLGLPVLGAIADLPAMAHDAVIVAMTANVMSYDIEQLQQAGFDGLIGKPVVRRIFPQLVERLLAGESVWYVP